MDEGYRRLRGVGAGETDSRHRVGAVPTFTMHIKVSRRFITACLIEDITGQGHSEERFGSVPVF